MVSGASPLGAAPQEQLGDAAAIVHRRPQRGKFHEIDRAAAKGAAGSATFGSRATTALELIKGRTNFKTRAVSRAALAAAAAAALRVAADQIGQRG